MCLDVERIVMSSRVILSRFLSRRPFAVHLVRTLKTGKDAKQPTAAAPLPKEEVDEELLVRPSSRPSVQPQPESYPKIPRVPLKPRLTKKEDLDKIIESWQNSLPQDEDPSVWDDEVKAINEGHGPAIHNLGKRLFSNDRLIAWQKKYDISYDGLRRWVGLKKIEKLRKEQAFQPMRHGILGPDLAAAHFIIFRLGRVKFCGHSEWFTPEQADKLPEKYDENWLVQKIDATGVRLLWEGLDNMVNLYHLEDLNLTNCEFLDVWSFNKLCRMYRFSTKLAKLNVSNCKNFCEYSLMNLHQIPSLKEVIITGSRAANYKHLKLIVLQLGNTRPDMKVIV